MKILLIEPPAANRFGTLRILGSCGTLKADIAWPPYDLMILAGLFKKMSQDSYILDAMNLGYSFKEVQGLIRDYQPDCVIFTTTTPTMANDCYTAYLAKKQNPKILTCAIGLSLPAYRFNILERFPDLDVAVYNEPELPLTNLVRQDLNPEGVLGLAYRKKNNTIVNNPACPRPYDLDQFGVPAQDKIPVSIYRDPLQQKRPMTLVNCSRGCKGVCKHCLSIFQRPLRYRSVENVLKELRLIRDLGIKEIKFFDCGLTNDLAWAQNFFKEIQKERFNFSWYCNARADSLPLELLRLMRSCGCHSVAIGSESASQKILTAMGKNISRDDIAQAVKNCRKAGIQSLLYFTLGLMEETEETILESLKFALQLQPDIVTFGIAIPVFKTEFYDYLKNNGFLKDEDESHYDTSGLPPYSYPWLSSQRIYELSLKCYRRFYFRPGYIVRRLSKLRSALQLKNDLLNLYALTTRILYGYRKKRYSPNPS